jgi:hypothetical protein
MTLDYEAIKRRCEAASPGPWEWVGSDLEKSPPQWGVVIEAPQDSCSTYGCCGGHGTNVSLADQDFIAHARTDIPDLLAAVEALQAENKRMRKALKLMLLPGPVLEDEAIRVRHRFRNIARAALSTPPRQEEVK